MDIVMEVRKLLITIPKWSFVNIYELKWNKIPTIRLLLVLKSINRVISVFIE